MLDAVARAGLRAVPQAGSDVGMFIHDHLLPLVEDQLGHDARATVEQTLQPLLGTQAALPPTTPKPKLPASPPVRLESGHRARPITDRRTLAEGGVLPTVVVASIDEDAIVRVHGALKGAALVRPAVDIAALADALCDGDVGAIIIDNRRVENRIANPRLLLAALDTTAVVLIWGEDPSLLRQQRANVHGYPPDTSTEELAYLALALLPGEEEEEANASLGS